MDWLILILLVPAIIVPIVLLWGFAGCGEFGTAAPDKTPAPTNLKATAKGTNLITLEWQNNAAETAKFKVTRVEEGSSPPPPKVYDNLAGKTFDDTMDVKEGTTYFYEVNAGSPSGYDSDPSNQSAATAFPAVPSDVKATPEDVNRIGLSWKNNSAKATRFIVRGESIPVGSVTETEVPEGAALPFPVTVPEGTTHKFEVLAFVKDGFQENLPQPKVKSLPSAPITAKPLAFKATLTTDQPNRQGRCLVQRISKGLLKNKALQENEWVKFDVFTVAAAYR
jgi:hypothetical protein